MHLLNLLAAIELPDPAWLWHRLAFMAIWLAELTAVQRATLRSPWGSSRRFDRFALVVRTLIDACFVTAATFALPSYGLMAITLIAFAVHFGLLAHYRHLNRPLSMLALIYNWREGMKSWPRSSPLQPARSTLLLLAALVAKLALLATSPAEQIDPVLRWTTVGVAAAGYIAMLAAASCVDPLVGIRGSRGFGRMGMIRGYFATWLGEIYYCGGRKVLDHAIHQREIVRDRLTPMEASIPIQDRLVVIQAESLDFNVFDFRAGDQEVTPFLNRLRQRSMFYRLAGARYMGSADVDFTMLAGMMPSTRIVNFKIPGFPYDDALPKFLSDFGYRTEIFHGNTGSFYNRRLAFERMGFSKIYFKEELEHCGDVPDHPWGIDDAEVFRFSVERLIDEPGRNCHFIITMTTHTPYDYVRPENWEIFPKPQSMAQHFLNGMRYLDNLLRHYVERLGAATVVIYGDHAADPALKSSAEFQSHWPGGQEFIPCLIFDTTQDLAARQQTARPGVADDGSITLLDFSGYLRTQIARNDRRDSSAGKSNSDLDSIVQTQAADCIIPQGDGYQ
jgi:hypothetical protein